MKNCKIGKIKKKRYAPKEKKPSSVAKTCFNLFSDIIQNKNNKSKEAWIYIGIH